MITLTSAEDALKTLYLGVVGEQLNLSTNPLLAKIEKTSQDVWGKEIVKMVPYGINGGIGAGTETGALPTATGKNYAKFTATLKNLYGNIEISDKAIRASDSSEGAFVNLLNSEMESLIASSKFNLSRMLYGDGSGTLCTTVADADNTTTVIKVGYTQHLMEGLCVDFIVPNTGVVTYSAKTITKVDRDNNTVTVSPALTSAPTATTFNICIHGSKGNEITGLKGITDNATIYGLTRADHYWLNSKKANVDTLTTRAMQTAIDDVDQVFGSGINFISASYENRRAYLDLLDTNRRNIDYMNLDGGYKAVSFNGIPVVADKFVPTTLMYLINTDDFKLHQLCDWRWLESENGKILQRKSGLPIYEATLVKYAELMCDRPGAICVITNSGATNY